MKRQTFYIRADLFEVRISPRAKLILAYLFRVSDRQGRSHPSVSTVAYRCGAEPSLRLHRGVSLRLLPQFRPQSPP